MNHQRNKKSERRRRRKQRRSRKYSTQPPFDPVEKTVRRLFPHLSPDIVRIACAAWLANDDKLGFDDPCWLALIAPPSTAKTVILTALSDATKGYILDTLTAQTFMSGLKMGKKQFSLLRLLGDRPNLFIKDLSGILTKQSYERQEIIGQLRAIYDGEFARPTGRGGEDDMARWRGRMTLMIGVTPLIDIYHTINNQLGERFIQLRYEIAEEDVVAVAGQALKNSRDGASPRRELAEALKQGIERARPFLKRDALSPHMEDRITNLVAFVTKARAGVIRDQGKVLLPPSPEGPGRLIKQLVALGCGLAALRGTRRVTDPDYALIERVAMDSIPDTRRKILEALYDRGAKRVKDFKSRVAVSHPTIVKHLEDLVILGLAVESKNGTSTVYYPSPRGTQYLNAARNVCIDGTKQPTCKSD